MARCFFRVTFVVFLLCVYCCMAEWEMVVLSVYRFVLLSTVCRLLPLCIDETTIYVCCLWMSLKPPLPRMYQSGLVRREPKPPARPLKPCFLCCCCDVVHLWRVSHAPSLLVMRHSNTQNGVDSETELALLTGDWCIIFRTYTLHVDIAVSTIHHTGSHEVDLVKEWLAVNFSCHTSDSSSS